MTTQDLILSNNNTALYRMKYFKFGRDTGTAYDNKWEFYELLSGMNLLNNV
jgi:hypothetical protein